MTNKSLIHVKVSYYDLVGSKKEVLSTEASLIKLLQVTKRFHDLRKKEFILKMGLLRKLKETKTEIKKLESELPKFETPKKIDIKKENSERLEFKKEKIKKDELEIQLEEIQDKLRELER